MQKYKIIPIWKILVRDGKTSMKDEEYQRYRKWCLSHSGQYEFVIKKHFNKRSRKQDGYYFGIVLPMIAEAMGEIDVMKAHAILKGIFLVRSVMIRGKEYQAVGRYSKLSSEGQQEFVEKCRIWAAQELDLDIPDPDKDWNSRPILVDNDI